MKLRYLYSILGLVGFIIGLVAIGFFIGNNNKIGVGGTIIGVIGSIFGSLSSYALISLSNVMEENEKQQDELNAIKEYIKSKEDSKDFLKEIDKINIKYNNNDEI